MHISLPRNKSASRAFGYRAQQIVSHISWGISAALGTIVGAGVVLGPAWFRTCIALALLGLPYFYAAYKHNKLFTRHLWYALLFAAISSTRAYYAQRHFIGAAKQITTGPCSIIARIVSEDYKPSHRFSYVVRVDNISISGDNKVAQLPGMLELYVRSPVWLLPGDYIIVKNIRLKPYLHTKMYLWALRYNLIASAFLEPSQIAKKKGRDVTLQRSIHKLKIGLLKTLKSLLTPTAYRLFKTIILGITWNSYATDRLRCVFMSWGLAHMLARSGLHMLLIISMLGMAGLPLGTASTPFFSLTMGAIFLLSLFSWNGLSFVRSVLMWMIARIGHHLRRRPHVLHTLGLTTICCILWQPAIIFFLDFQLSFGVTGILAFMSLLQTNQPAQSSLQAHKVPGSRKLISLKPLK